MNCPNKIKYQFDRNLVMIWGIIILFITLIWMPRITKKGMFIDGLVYTTISQNMSQGIGNFWNPKLRNSAFLFFDDDNFIDHPPLVFKIESVFFKLFKNKTEIIYNTLIIILLIYAIYLLANIEYRNIHSFVPVILLFTIPEFNNKCAANMLDTTMAVFDTFAVFYITKSLINNTKIRYLTIGSLFIILAFLSKGFVGLFPLITPFIFWMCFKNKINFKSVIISSIVIISIVLAFAIFLLSGKNSSSFLNDYIQKQVLLSISGGREKINFVGYHFEVVTKTLIQISVILFLTSVSLSIILMKGIRIVTDDRKKFLYYLLIALSASLPIGISAKNLTFYLIPSFVFYCIAFSYIIKYLIPNTFLEKRFFYNKFLVISFLIASFFFIVLYLVRKPVYYKSHKEVLKQLELLNPYLPKGELVYTSFKTQKTRGDLLCYLEKDFNIELTNNVSLSDYILINKKDTLIIDDIWLAKIYESNNYTLYKKSGK